MFLPTSQLCITIAIFLFGISSLNNVNSQVTTSPPTAPYLTFEGRVIPNNSKVQSHDGSRDPINDIKCHTDLTTCCNATYGTHSGRWVNSFPDRFETTFGQGHVSLILNSNFLSGNYRCEIDTVASIASGGPREILYVGRFQGRPQNVISTLTVSTYDTQPGLFSLTCRVVFIPATFVKWMRDSVEIEGGVTTEVTNQEYLNVLNTTVEGVYTCHVTVVEYVVFSNVTTERSFTDQRTINITRPLPPTNLTVVQTGIKSVLVSWIPSGRPSRYIIYYQQQGFNFRRQSNFAGGNDTSVTLSDLSEGQNYSVSILAETALQSSEVGPVSITIDHLQIFIRRSSIPFRGAYPGQMIRLTCQVTLIGTLTGTPTISWQGPLSPLPTPTVDSSSEHVFTSEFIIDSVNSSHEGEYTCTAWLEGFPVPVESQTRIYINYQSRLSLESSAKILTRNPLKFTLTCTTTGGFPANVTWLRGSEVLEGGISVVSDTFRNYDHSLNATVEGMYMCIVSNNIPDSINTTFNATVPLAPSNLSISQNGKESVLVSWIQSDGVEYYTIDHYQNSRFLGSIQVEADNNSVTIPLRFSIRGEPFMFTIVANTALQSIKVGPVNFTLGILQVFVYEEQSSSVVGRQHTLYCNVAVFGDLIGSPIFTWNGPGDLPEPAISPENNFTSMLTYNPLKLSHGGEVNCTVGYTNFPYQDIDDIQLDPIIPNYLIPRASIVTSHMVPFHTGTVLNLTCDIMLSPSIDLPVVESTQWVIDDVVLDTPVSTDRVTFSESSIVFSPLNTSDSKTYRCNVKLTFENFYRRGLDLDLNVEIPPPPEVELTASSTVLAGSALTVECSVTAVPHFIKLPRVELIGPGDIVLAATSTNLNLTHTIDTVLASYAGQQYVCKTVLEIDSVDIHLQSFSDAYTINVQISRPNVTITADQTPDDIIVESSITLTCTAVLDPVVDSFGDVVIMWSGPRIISEGQYIVRNSGIGLIHSSNLTITDLEIEDEGEYVCTVRVSGGRNLFGITVDEVIPITVFVPMPIVTVYSIGNYLLTCRTRFNVEPPAYPLQNLVVTFKWEGPALSSSGNYTIDETQLRFNSHLNFYYIDSYLTINDIDYQDAGEYLCTVIVSSNGNDIGNPITESNTSSVPAPPPPEVELKAASTVVAGSELTIECCVTIAPDLIIELTNVELIGPQNTVLAATNTVLNLSHTLYPVLASYAGIYFCKATVHVEGLNEPLMSQSNNHTLTVFIPAPNITLFSSSMDPVTVSSSVTLICNATLNSLNDVVESVSLDWSGPRLSSGYEKYSISQSSVGLSYTSSLMISNIVKDDEGEYACTVNTENDNQNAISSSVTEFIFLSVAFYEPELVLTVSPSAVLNTSSPSLTLTCDATLYNQLDEVELIWSGPQVISDNDNKYSIVDFSSELRYSSTLIVLDIEKEDEGEYVCSLTWFDQSNDRTNTIHESVLINVTVLDQKNSGGIVYLSSLSAMIVGAIAIFISF